METFLPRVEHLIPWQISPEGFIVGVMMEVSVMGQEGIEMQGNCTEIG